MTYCRSFIFRPFGNPNFKGYTIFKEEINELYTPIPRWVKFIPWVEIGYFAE